MSSFKIYGVMLIAAALSRVYGCAATRTHEAGARAHAPAQTMPVARTQASPAPHVDDSVITSRVRAAIFGEPGLRASEVSVETAGGVVQLRGFVSSLDDINQAVKVAQAVDGVSAVRNDLHVKL